MERGENPLDINWLNFDAFDALEQKPINKALRNVYDYFCSQQIEAGESPGTYKWETGIDLSLKLTHSANRLIVRARMPETLIYDYINIGYYSPRDGDFIIYPEIVTSEDSDDPSEAIDQLKSQAFKLREEEIDRFNIGPPIMRDKTIRIDYSAPIIQQLHREHFSYIEGLNLRELLDEYSFYKLHETGYNLYADECTRACVCFRPKYFSSARYLSVRVQGAYLESDGLKKRKPEVFINIAERSNKHSLDFKIVDDMIQPYELDTYIELGQMVIAQSKLFKGPDTFNEQYVAINARPQLNNIATP